MALLSTTNIWDNLRVSSISVAIFMPPCHKKLLCSRHRTWRVPMNIPRRVQLYTVERFLHQGFRLYYIRNFPRFTSITLRYIRKLYCVFAYYLHAVYVPCYIVWNVPLHTTCKSYYVHCDYPSVSTMKYSIESSYIQ